MRVLGLISGGKDSIYNLMECQKQGHDIVALANLRPEELDELDSFMFQTVGHHGIEKIAEAMELPLYRRFTQGVSRTQTMNYQPTDNDEVEDLYQLLSETKKEVPFEAVAVGAILSDYQRIRVENVCSRLNLVSMSYLWRRDQAELLKEMIDNDVDAILIKVASLGLEPKKHLGVSIANMYSYLLQMQEKFGLNVCGEGGEYETFTLNCPLFKQKIVIDEMKAIVSSEDNTVCSVGFLHFDKMHLESKDFIPVNNSNLRLEKLIESEYSDTELENDTEIEEYNLPETNFKLFNDPNCSKNDKWINISGIAGNGISVEEGMKNAMAKLEEIILLNGHKLVNLCYINLYVNKLSEYTAINKIYCDKINFSNPPPRVCVESPLPDKTHVLIDAIAFDDAAKSDRFTLHVQGISHWAPANIGPYSQLTKINDTTLISGQIGLIPGSLTIIPGGVIKECCLTLQNIKRVAKAVNSKYELSNIVQGICYVTRPDHVKLVRKIIEKKTKYSIIDYIVVRGLPRNALVEMQIWMHKSNDEFHYSEEVIEIDVFRIKIRMKKSRGDDDANCLSTITCLIEDKNSNQNNSHIIKNLTTLTMEKIMSIFFYIYRNVEDNSSINDQLYLKIFYPMQYYTIPSIIDNSFTNLKNEKKIKFSQMTIPVVSLVNTNTILSISCTCFK